jgi:LPXTG-motif cell wall-anchored protein
MLNYLNGVNNTNMNGLLDKFTTAKNNAIQKLPPAIKKAVDTGGKIAQVGAKISFAVVRGSFLAILRVNFLHVAENMEKAIRKDRNKVKNWWQDFGGDFDELLRITNLGIKAGEQGKAQALTGSYLGVDPVTGAATTATPASASFLSLLKSIGVTAVKEIVQTGTDAGKKALTDSAKDLVNKGKQGLTDAINKGKTPAGVKPTVLITPKGVDPSKPTTTVSVTPTATDTTEKKSNMPLIIGGIAVLGIGAFFLLKKKK